MIRRIAALKPDSAEGPRRKFEIGCLMISDPVLFDDGELFAQPSDFPVHPQGAGKTYDLTSGEGERMWQECLARARAGRVSLAAEQEEAWAPLVDGPRYGMPQLVRPRLGQGTFRVAVTQAYQGACAITGEDLLRKIATIGVPAAGEPDARQPGTAALRSLIPVAGRLADSSARRAVAMKGSLRPRGAGTEAS